MLYNIQLYNKEQNTLAKMSETATITTPSVDETLLQTKVPCETKEGDKVPVKVALLLISRTFETMWKDLNMSSASGDQVENYVFPVKAISTRTFKKVVEWLEEHVGKPVPVIEEDAATKERKWFTLTEYEQSFFEVNVEELAELLVAGNFLDIPSLYLYGCQSMASIIKDKNPEEIRAMFGLEDDLTEEEKQEIKRKNVWCNY